MANNKNPRSAVMGSVSAHLATSNTNGSIVRTNITIATANRIGNRAHLLNGNAPANVVVSGLNNSAMPSSNVTQYVKLHGQGIALQK